MDPHSHHDTSLDPLRSMDRADTPQSLQEELERLRGLVCDLLQANQRLRHQLSALSAS